MSIYRDYVRRMSITSSSIKGDLGFLSGYPSLVKGGRLKICCTCFVGSNPTSDIIYFLICFALLAQSGERATVNREAAGSKPARSVIFY